MVIGITGTDGAGKGTAVEYLVQEKNFVHYSSREFIVAEIERRGLPVDRNQMRLVANEMRSIHGNEFVVSQAYDKAIKEGHEYIVIESLRALAEAEFLKSEGGILLAVDADVNLRYERVEERRSESDKISFGQFVAHEELEKNDTDPHGMQKSKVIEMADFTIYNNSTKEALFEQVEKVLKQLEI